MALITRDSIKLSLEVKTGVDSDGMPKYSKKSINFKLKEDVTLDNITEKAGAVMTLVGNILDYEHRYFFITESSEMKSQI